MGMEELADLCMLQMEQLRESVDAYAPHAGGSLVAGYGTPRNAQANRTAILRQVTGLRQSLLALGKEVAR